MATDSYNVTYTDSSNQTKTVGIVISREWKTGDAYTNWYAGYARTQYYRYPYHILIRELSSDKFGVFSTIIVHSYNPNSASNQFRAYIYLVPAVYNNFTPYCYYFYSEYTHLGELSAAEISAAFTIPKNFEEIVKIVKSTLNLAWPNTYDVKGYTNSSDLIQLMFSELTSFHSDPIFIEATKLKYTDGTYNFARGNKTADTARKAAYKHLLNTYGTFYKGTEEELSPSYIQGLSSPDINGGGVTKIILSYLQNEMEVAA